MAGRTIAVNGEQWEVSSTGRITQYGKDEFGLRFTRRLPEPVVDRVVRYSPRLSKNRESALAQLSDGDLKAKCTTPAGTQITTWKWLRAMVEHEAHHRGQIYLMLGILGVDTPPLYGLTEEEVRAKTVVPHL